jgi:hypothetical protein
MKRFRLGLAGLAAFVGLFALVLAAPAGATHVKRPSVTPPGDFPGNPTYQGFDPMETSVPYLAWRGEEVRLVKCLTPATTGLTADQLLDAEAEWQIMDWSGDDHVWPRFFDDLDQRTIAFVGRGDQADRICWAIDITSHKPGIAVVKMKLDLPDTATDGNPLNGEGDPVLAHQFNVIWMTLSQAILRNLPEGGVGPIVETRTRSASWSRAPSR